MATANELFKQAFNCPRDPRSQAYKAGVLAALHFKFDGVDVVSPYQAGTTESDAFYAGTEEGFQAYRRWQERE
jgi:hypothetical protein